jgi:hypothetical protein
MLVMDAKLLESLTEKTHGILQGSSSRYENASRILAPKRIGLRPFLTVCLHTYGYASMVWVSHTRRCHKTGMVLPLLICHPATVCYHAKAVKTLFPYHQISYSMLKAENSVDRHISHTPTMSIGDHALPHPRNSVISNFHDVELQTSPA